MGGNKSGTFPEIFANFHSGEEHVRLLSIEKIEANRDLLLHVGAIKVTMDLLNFFVLKFPSTDHDVTTIQLLGIRLFNDIGASMKLLLSGYYQAATTHGRDALETTFLLDLFTSDRPAIAQWRSWDKAAQKRFRPVNVRKELDARDGFKGEKRGQMYKRFCEMAAHPNVAGFSMLAPANNLAHCGPFFEAKALDAVLSELARLAVQAATVFSIFFPADNVERVEVKLACMEGHGDWCERFYSRHVDRERIDEIKALLARAR